MTANRDKRALITGATGQDGAYLSQFLLKKDYEVVAIPSCVAWLQEGRFGKRHDFGRFPNRAVQIPEGVARVVEVLQPPLSLYLTWPDHGRSREQKGVRPFRTQSCLVESFGRSVGGHCLMEQFAGFPRLGAVRPVRMEGKTISNSKPPPS